MTFGSLFAGIGGLDLGFEWAGFTPVWQVELNPFCRAVLAKHWPDVQRFDDVRTVGAHNLEPVDVIVGGFPCQDVSDAGLRAGIDGERSGLWREFARVVRELRPRIVVVENVSGLLVRGMGRVLGDLADLGYDAEWVRVRASDVGAPHRRGRIFIVAYTKHDAGRVVQQRDERGPSFDWKIVTAASDRRVAYAGGDGFSRGGEPQPAGLEGARGELADGCGDGRTGAATMADTEHGRGHARVGCEGSTRGLSDPHWRGSDRWPARPGEPQHAWEPPRALRRAESGVGVVPDGLPAGLVRHRRRALEALGNAVVPQVAYVVACRACAILEALP